MATLSRHSNQNVYPIGTKNELSFPTAIDAICEMWLKSLHGFRGDFVWKCWPTDDDGRLPILLYKLTKLNEPSAQIGYWNHYFEVSSNDGNIS